MAQSPVEGPPFYQVTTFHSPLHPLAVSLLALVISSRSRQETNFEESPAFELHCSIE